MTAFFGSEFARNIATGVGYLGGYLAPVPALSMPHGQKDVDPVTSERKKPQAYLMYLESP